MNKSGIVVQVNKNIVSLMTPDGQFVRVKAKDRAPNKGEVYSGEIYNKAPVYKLPIMAALLSFFMLLSGGMYTYYTPAAELTVSINPSVKITLNMWKRIIKSTPLNDDGEKILSSLKLSNKPLDEGLNLIVEQAKIDNFINEAYKENGKTISVHINNSKSKNIDLTGFQQSIEAQDIDIEIIDDNNDKTSKDKPSKENNDKENIDLEKKPEENSTDESEDKNINEQSPKDNKKESIEPNNEPSNKNINNDTKSNSKNKESINGASNASSPASAKNNGELNNNKASNSSSKVKQDKDKNKDKQ